jgi:hypothetical protein
MVEAPSQVRDAIAQTRADVAETIHSLGERVDAARHAAEAVSSEADRVRSAAVQATGKVADRGQHALGSAASRLKAGQPKRRALLPLLIATGLGVGILALFAAKRRRGVVEDPRDWEPTED